MEEDSLLTVIGSFVGYYRYWIYSGIALLILIVLLLFYIKGKARVWKIRKLIKDSSRKNGKKAKEKKTAEEKKKVEKKRKKKKVSFKWVYWLIGIVLVAALVFLIFKYTNYFVMAVNNVWTFLLNYIWYIVIGFILLWIVIGVLSRKDKKK